MIWHTREGEFTRQGINWDCSRDSKLRLIIKIWRFIWYFRIRADYLCHAPNNCEKYVWNFMAISSYDENGYMYILKNFSYSYDIRTFKINNRLVSEELFMDLISEIGKKIS